MFDPESKSFKKYNLVTRIGFRRPELCVRN